MNDLYIHQLETENKQLREALKSTNEVVKEYLDKEKYCDELENKIDNVNKYINDLLKKEDTDKTILEAIKFMLGGKKMNKASKELLDKTIKLKNDERLPLFKGIYIIQQRKLHDSGFRMMYVIGHTKYDENINDFHYYLVGTYSDVIDFTSIYNKLIKRNYDMCDLHLDINKDGLIHIWTNSNKYLSCVCPFVSSCSFEILGDKENE